MPISPLRLQRPLTTCLNLNSFPGYSTTIFFESDLKAKIATRLRTFNKEKLIKHDQKVWETTKIIQKVS